MSIDHHSSKIASDCSASQKFPSYTFTIGILFKMQRIERVKMAINQFPSHPLIHHMTTPTAKDIFNSSTIHFGNYKKTAIRHFPRHTKSSSTSLIHPSIYRSTHYPKSSSTSLILIHLHPSMATPAATAVPAGAASAATHRPQPCFHTQVVDST